MIFDTFRKIILNVTTVHDHEGERAVTRNMVNINRFDSYPRTDYGMMSQNVQRRSQSSRRKKFPEEPIGQGAGNWPELIEYFNIGGCVICRTLNTVIVKRDLVISVYVTCCKVCKHISLWTKAISCTIFPVLRFLVSDFGLETCLHLHQKPR